MSDDGTDWGPEEESLERPFGARPFGAKPFGAKPFGARPFGAKPFGAKPFGAKPFGAKPFGARPFGARPFGAKPFGAKPFGDEEVVAGFLDPDEWAADIADLVCERSAVIRLGATLVYDEYELRVPRVDANHRAPAYMAQKEADAEEDEAEEEEAEEKPRLKGRELKLRPSDHELAAKVVLRDRLARDIAQDPVLAEAVKEDLAEALALRADRAFLHGAPPEPTGIANLPSVVQVAGADLLAAARALVEQIRWVDPARNPVFRAPGWIVHPRSVDTLAKTATPVANTSVDMFQGLLRHDGVDGGWLLGYPFVVSAATFDGAKRGIFFSADWREAWIGIDGTLVEIDISTDAHFQTDEIVLRATMHHDFILRRPRSFTWGVDGFPRMPAGQIVIAPEGNAPEEA